MTTTPTKPDDERRRRHRAAKTVREACAEAASVVELVEGIRGPIGDALGVSGMVLGGTDPSSLIMSTATHVENLPHAMAAPWMHNEAFERDFNKFLGLHRSGSGASTLHRVTQGNPQLSPRYRLHEQLGLGPEMRVTFSSSDECWGVANLVREHGDPDFGEDGVEWIDELRAEIAAGLQRTIAAEVNEPEDRTPGVVMLDAECQIRALTAEARALLCDLWMCPVEVLDDFLPGEAYMVATIARANGQRGAPDRVAKTRVRGRSGRWITVSGDCTMTPSGELSEVVLVIEPSRPTEILPLLVAAHGLTAREREVLTQMMGGESTAEIAPRLFISEHTVRDHIKSILSKTATTSRGELMSKLFQHR